MVSLKGEYVEIVGVHIGPVGQIGIYRAFGFRVVGWLGRESEVRKQVPRGTKTRGFSLGFGFRAFGLRVELRVSCLECRASGLDIKIIDMLWFLFSSSCSFGLRAL